MRVLDLVKIDEQNEVQLSDSNKKLWMIPGSEHPFPLPERSRTEPHLTIQSHTGMENNLEKTIANWEEIKTGSTKSETPLVAFTLLAQMAAGMAIISLFYGPLTLPILTTIGGLIGISGLVAFLHLGTPINAWRAPFHLKKSWLSREILIFGLFGFSWSLALFFPGMGKLPLALCGIGLVFSMAQVYRLRSIQAWDTTRTLLTFTVSAMVLGGLGLASLSGLKNIDFDTGYLFAGTLGLIGTLLLSLSGQQQVHQTAHKLRLGLIALALLGAVGMMIVTYPVERWLVVLIFLIALTEEALGRWLFYEHLHQRVL
jgi:DMSO reductase anchor subunit